MMMMMMIMMMMPMTMQLNLFSSVGHWKNEQKPSPGPIGNVKVKRSVAYSATIMVQNVNFTKWITMT